jgi:hypothetical protein
MTSYFLGIDIRIKGYPISPLAHKYTQVDISPFEFLISISGFFFLSQGNLVQAFTS